MDIPDHIQLKMTRLYNSLSEKDRRRYAAIEAQKIGYGGISYICTLFGCDEKTVKKGIHELGDDEVMNSDRVRKAGGGRRSKLETNEDINSVFLEVLKDHTAGDPMKVGIKWTNLSNKEIVEKMAERGINISKNIVRRLFKINKYVKRKMQKSKATEQHEDRNEQFERISSARKRYESTDNPIISIDAKKAEKIGELYREGKIECKEALQSYDHDFPSLASGEIKLYSVYDLKNYEAFVNIGTSHDTSEFACDSIVTWWNLIGKIRYPQATSMLCLADSGGSNSVNSELFKEDLQNISNQINLDIQMAHYPPGTSKWNPIEHRVFPHITRSLSGVLLNSINLAKELIERTKTSTGLKVFAHISKKSYEKGRKISDDFNEKINLIQDSVLGKWNYVIFHDA